MAKDAKLDLFDHTVTCVAVRERMVGGWKLDPRESTSEAPFARRPGSVGQWGSMTESR